jgi:polyphenol oxidase
MIKPLKKIKWTRQNQDCGFLESSLLKGLGVPHGFLGVNQSRPKNLHFLRQVHGTGVLSASQASEEYSDGRLEGDAITTEDKNKAIAVKTADCLPLLISSLDGSKVAAVHAGWRGLSSGIVLEALNSFETKGSRLKICIGPNISREAFEVGPEVIEIFLSQNHVLPAHNYSLAISKGRGDRWHFDLSLAAVLQVLHHGVDPESIEVLQVCTYSNPTYWNSFRRMGPGCASNWSWIQPKIKN